MRLEEAQGYHALSNEFKRSQDEIAKIVGKSRSHVANMMRLTKLPEDVQALIASGQLSAGHARALIGVPDPVAAAKRIVEEGLNVRQAEALAHVEGVPESASRRRRAAARSRIPTRSRWKNGSATRWAWPSTSITAIPAAPCTSATAISNSSTRSCDGWTQRGSTLSLARDPKRDSAIAVAASSKVLRASFERAALHRGRTQDDVSSPPPLRIHRDRHQHALRDHRRQRRLLARLQRRGRELFDDSDQSRRAEIPQRDLGARLP